MVSYKRFLDKHLVGAHSRITSKNFIFFRNHLNFEQNFNGFLMNRLLVSDGTALTTIIPICVVLY